MKNSKVTTQPKIGRKKHLIFKGIALLLPFVFIAVLELSLRLFGYGYDVRLFVDDDENPDYWMMSPHASKPYFSNTGAATVGVFEPFRKHKQKGSLRIFVLGESTTLGYPYMAAASFDRWLLYRLMHTFPDREFEIVNLSLTAVNSYTVLGFAKELVNYEPDAVLIYCGHNEYYGTLGVGSTSKLGNNRAVIQSLLYLRSFRLVQLLGNAYSGLKGIASERHEEASSGTLMKRLAAQQEIPLNSTLYFRGIEQFRGNMEDVCKILTQKGVPVFVSTLVSNEKDLHPFISSKTEKPGSAEHYFNIASAAFKNGEYATAKEEFVRAKELDLLRFRAPEAMNMVIEGLPKKFRGVYLVDTKKLFETQSSQGIIGNETILEHVHPNIYGYGLMSEAFYQSVKQHNIITPGPNPEISLEQLRREMPITKVDSLKGAFEIMVLKENWPFNQPKAVDFSHPQSYEEQLALELLFGKINWVTAMGKQMDFYLKRHDQLNELKVAEATVLQFPNNSGFQFYAGKVCMDLGRNDKAKVYLQHAFRLSSEPETAHRLAILFLKDDQPEKALPYLNFLGQANVITNYSMAISLTGEIIAGKNKLGKDSVNIGLLNRIALDYYKMQNSAVALKYAEKAFQVDKYNNETLGLLDKIKTMPGPKSEGYGKN